MQDLQDNDVVFKNSVNTDNYILPALKKQVDKRGFMYIVKDSAYPEVFKIGMTGNPKNRLSSYNKDKPFKTAAYILISLPFLDVRSVEAIILEQLYKETNPTSLTKEWFFMEHFDRAKYWIDQAEKKAELL